MHAAGIRSLPAGPKAACTAKNLPSLQNGAMITKLEITGQLARRSNPFALVSSFETYDTSLKEVSQKPQISIMCLLGPLGILFVGADWRGRW
jgi:hypothetical protein